ncbi:MAG TPA: MFS transporter [Acidimicrobiales bacterium]|nr:MFS transporter [Acidimicrobiales bacterium]
MSSDSTSGSPAGNSKSTNPFLGRQLAAYPSTATRVWLLGLVTITTVVLYYIYFIPGGVLPLLLPYYHMSFLYFMTLIVISNAGGAFTAFIGGLSDRIGRANLTIMGLAVLGVLQAFVIPNAHSRASFDAAYIAIGFVEGIILVVTPALIRDFSPQMGRAAAMGFWTLGPVLGSLTVSQVATHTLPHLHPWQDQFMISGIACLGMFVIGFLGLRELSPAIRDQLMVTAKERSLVEARAKGIDVEAALANPVRSMFKLDLLTSSVAISLFLLLYYALVTIVTLYWVIVFSKTTADANGINTWYFIFDGIGLVLMGFISDRLRVRKPFMVAGAVGYIVVSLIFISKVHSPHTGYYSLAAVMGLLGFTSATAYSPWMAHYTEAVEAKNPALSATGLSVWGWVLRIIVAGSFIVIPQVISSVSPLVNNQDAATALQTLQAASPYAKTGAPPLPASINSELLAAPKAYAAPLETLSGYLQTKKFPTTAQGLAQLQGLLAFQPLATSIQNGHNPTAAQIASVNVHSPQLAELLAKEEVIVPAQKNSPNQWEHWWWVCFAGEVIFLALVFTMKGPWSPKSAREEFEAHQKLVAEEMTKLGISA